MLSQSQIVLSFRLSRCDFDRKKSKFERYRLIVTQPEEITRWDLHSSAIPSARCKSAFFGDEGAGEGSPTSLMEKLCRLGLGVLSVQSKDGAALCEWLRMKVSAGFLEWKRTEASRGYESYRQTHDV